MLDDTPQTRVVLADKAGGSGHRHILDESHDERFETKREAGSRPCPRHVDQAHATVGTVDAGDARLQVGLVLKEIKVAPGLLHRVVHWALGLATLGTGKPATGLEVDLEIEPLLVDVDFGVTTIQGGPGRSASWNSSISRMVSPRAPFDAIVPPSSWPTRTSPWGRAILARFCPPLDTSAYAVCGRGERMAPQD